MRHILPKPFTQEELEYYKPDITKAMHGIKVEDKRSILRNCIKDHFDNKKVKNASIT